MKSKEDSVTELLEAIDDLSSSLNALSKGCNTNTRIDICEDTYRNYMLGHQPQKAYKPDFRTPEDFIPFSTNLTKGDIK